MSFSSPAQSGRWPGRAKMLGALGAATLGVAVVVAAGCEALDSAGGSGPWPAGVLYLDQPFGTHSGSLSSGAPMDLTFAAQASMGCFPAPANGWYGGNHVLYGFSVPSGTAVTVRVTPGVGQDLSLYGYSLGATRFETPPTVQSAVSCEASPSSSNNPNGPDQPEEIHFSASPNPYNFLVGVAAPVGTSGGYSLQILAQYCSRLRPGEATALPYTPSSAAIASLICG